jgi:hypothetical protein
LHQGERASIKFQDAAYWAKRPELIQAGRVLTDNSGGPQMLTVMSTQHNRKLSKNWRLESHWSRQAWRLLVEHAYVIQGVGATGMGPRGASFR